VFVGSLVLIAAVTLFAMLMSWWLEAPPEKTLTDP
jgi:hypothetical protein